MWAHLVGRARAEGGCWTVGCARVALPALVRVVARYPGDVQSAGAELLPGVFAGLVTADLGRPHVLLRLMWAARQPGLPRWRRRWMRRFRWHRFLPADAGALRTSA
ncbi:hypothetical protein DMH18_11995 [Streptomyces sp. WAC 06783]|nr:hypothetical protein DMH18_11995 [Streptomyces sp. WAC 06783]